MTEAPLPEAERVVAAAIFTAWLYAAHQAARKRSAIAFREAADIGDLWRWLWATRWRTDA